MIGALLTSYALAFSVALSRRQLLIRALLAWMVGETAAALGLAACGGFTYAIWVGLHCALTVAAWTAVGLRLRRRQGWEPIDWHELAWGLGVAAVCGFELATAHFNYSGSLATAVDPYAIVDGFASSYPYVSDEWYAVALSKHMLATGGLPVINPLSANGELFVDVQMPFHALNAGVALLFDIDPLNLHVPLGIIANTVMMLLVFRLLRALGGSRPTSFVTACLASHLTHSANLPGLWAYIPFTVGLIVFLMFLIAVTERRRTDGGVALVLCIFFYPPLLIFVVPIYILLSWWPHKSRTELAMLGVGAIGVACLVLGSIAWVVANEDSDLTAVWRFLGERVQYRSLTGEYVEVYSPLYVLSPAACALVPFGLVRSWRIARILLLPAGLGAAFWLTYMFVAERLLLEPARAVFLTALLATVIAGVGLDAIVHWLERKHRWLSGGLLAVCFGYIAVYAIGYTTFNRWDRLYAYDPRQPKVRFMPASPANRHLGADELATFAQIHGQVILSTPWKSTVIATATDNYAVVTKSGTISMSAPGLIEAVRQSPCERQAELLEGIDYVYLRLRLEDGTPCGSLRQVFRSSEGFVLYEVAHPI